VPTTDDEDPPLPLPGLERPFGELVDAYTSHHEISKAETYRRIADVTGNSASAIALRYRNRGDQPWWKAAPMGIGSLLPLIGGLDADVTQRVQKDVPTSEDRPSREALVQAAMVIARFVRDALEDFHCDHLTDEQMAELNPLVRKGIVEALVIIEALTSPDPELRAGAEAALALNAPPSDWEQPEVPDLDETLRVLARAMASGTIRFGRD
jgi:hypothetical protein